jgi:predicted ATPase
VPATALRFVVVDRGVRWQPDQFPVVALHVDGWDDFSFKTMYSADLHVSQTEVYELGNVKILQLGQESGRPPVPTSFEDLDETFCSLGQDIAYYETLLQQVPEALRIRYLEALQDAANSAAVRDRFTGEQGFGTSLLRFGQAVNALEAGGELLQGTATRKDRMSFSFDWRRSTTPTAIDFVFDDSGELPGRCHVLIGYNGAGKTTLLADMALAASRGRRLPERHRDSRISGDDTTFGAVVAVSYSAFDTFRTPEALTGSAHEGYDHDSSSGEPASQTEVFGYVYCGLRRITHEESPAGEETYKLKSIDEIEAEFARALNTVGSAANRPRQLLVDAFAALAAEPSFGRAGVDLGQLGAGVGTDDTVRAFHDLSTGHKIVLNIVTQLAAHLRTRSLVLVDEPETHLHPPLMAALLRAIQILLRGHDSFAVLATHSPVVVQEMQARHVRVVDRLGDHVTIRPVTIESFGANVGAITRHIFSLDNSATDYQGILEGLARDYAVEQIEAMFESGLSPQARALVLNYQANQ